MHRLGAGQPASHKTEDEAAAAAAERDLERGSSLSYPEQLLACYDASEDFESVVSQLEVLAGRRLAGPGLSSCRDAFRTHPEGVRRVVADLINRTRAGGIRSPLGLFVRAIGDGDHTVAPPEAPAAEPVDETAAAIEQVIDEVYGRATNDGEGEARSRALRLIRQSVNGAPPEVAAADVRSRAFEARDRWPTGSAIALANHWAELGESERVGSHSSASPSPTDPPFFTHERQRLLREALRENVRFANCADDDFEDVFMEFDALRATAEDFERRQALWEMLLLEFGEPTASGREELLRAMQELLEIGASDDDLIERMEFARSTWSVSVTPSALVRNWGALKPTDDWLQEHFGAAYLVRYKPSLHVVVAFYRQDGADFCKRFEFATRAEAIATKERIEAEGDAYDVLIEMESK